MSTPAQDPFGDAVDADTVEDALKAGIQKWLPAWLAHEERRRGWDPGRLPRPRSWPVMSEFDGAEDLDPRDQRPAVVIVSGGTTDGPERLLDELRRTWIFVLIVVINDRDEREARKLAAPYLTATAMAATTEQTLGGIAEQVRWSGADRHDYASGTQEAVYGTVIEVTARAALPLYLAKDPDGVPVPPLDPYVPDSVPDLPLDVVVDVTATAEDQTP